MTRRPRQSQRLSFRPAHAPERRQGAEPRRRGPTLSPVDRQRYSRTVLGWPAALVAVGLGVYALVSAVTGHGDRALVLAGIAAVNALIAGTVILG